MRRRRLALGVAGIVALVAGVALGDAGGDIARAVVSALGNDYLLLVVLAGVAALVAVPAIVSGRSRNLDQTEMPATERPAEAPGPGAGFDRAVERRFDLGALFGEREDLRERLRTATVGALVRSGVERSTATERVERGEWTDDAVAAAFLAGDSPPLATRLRAWLGGRHWEQAAARHTARVLVEEVAR